MSIYVYGTTRAAQAQRRLDEQNAYLVQRNHAIDDRRRAERRAARNRAQTMTVEEVHAAAEQVRQWAVASMSPGFYHQGSDRLKAATDEAIHYNPAHKRSAA